MSRIITDDHSLLPFKLSGASRSAAGIYPFKTTEYYLALVRHLNMSDPVFLQLAPDGREIEDNHSPDPFCEEEKTKAPRLIHRYPQRAVFLANNSCASHCRHCMRKRRWTEAPSVASVEEVKEAARYCQEKQIEDIIISGGDPFLLPGAYLDEIVARFREVPSLKIIRIGTRLPVVDPERVKRTMLNKLRKRGPLYLMLHYNHPQEWSPRGDELLDDMRRMGFLLMNQSVLLKGVNDSEETLYHLFMGLLQRGVKPYYLHQCDLVRGVTHFWVELSRSVELLRNLKGRISGLAMPYLAIDLPGGLGKVLLGPSHRLQKTGSRYKLRTFRGKEVFYGKEE